MAYYGGAAGNMGGMGAGGLGAGGMYGGMQQVSSLGGYGMPATSYDTLGMSASINSNNNGGRTQDATKRYKAAPSEPSKVLHVRGCPAYTRKEDLIALCTQFGPVMQTLMLAQKNQAFVEMATVEAASQVISHYTTTQAYLNSKPVYFQFSSRDHISVPASQAVAGTGSEPQVGNVLLVTIHNDTVPVSIENLYQVFSPYGQVRKIITFLKNSQFKALVEMASVESAVASKLALEGKDMFQGCCTLQVGFSNMPALTVRQQGPKARDFSLPYNPAAQQAGAGAGAAAPMGMYGQFGGAMGGTMGGAMPRMQPANSPAMFGDKGPVLLVNNLDEEKMTPDLLFTLFGVYGDVMRVKILFNKKDTALIQFRDAQQAFMAQMHLNHLKLFDKELNVQHSKHQTVSLPNADMSADLTKDYSNSPCHRFKFSGSRNAKNICAPSPVLFISNVIEGTTGEQLKDHFHPHELLAYEFFKTDRKMVFARFHSTEHAVVALLDRHNSELGGRQIRVSFSPKDPSMIGMSEEEPVSAEDDSKDASVGPSPNVPVSGVAAPAASILPRAVADASGEEANLAASEEMGEM